MLALARPSVGGACNNQRVTPRDRDAFADLPDGERFLTLEEVARVLRIPEALARDLVEGGELHAVQIGEGGPWRVERALLERYIDDRYEVQRAASRTNLPGDDDFAELWGAPIPEDEGRLPFDEGGHEREPGEPGRHTHLRAVEPDRD